MPPHLAFMLTKTSPEKEMHMIRNGEEKGDPDLHPPDPDQMPPLSEGWRFVFWVFILCRLGLASAWIFIAKLPHSHAWSAYVATDPERMWPVLHTVIAMLLGGQLRWNHMP